MARHHACLARICFTANNVRNNSTPRRWPTGWAPPTIFQSFVVHVRTHQVPGCPPGALADPARNMSRSACPAAATPLASSSDRRISDQRYSRAERAATWVPSRFTTRCAAMTGGHLGSATVGLLPATLPNQQRRGLGVRCGGSHTRRGQVPRGPNLPGTRVSLVTGIAACRQPPVPGERRRSAPSRVRGSSSHTAEGSPRWAWRIEE